MRINEMSGKIISSAMKVHTKLGPGLLENAYETCLSYEIRKTGMKAERQKTLPLIYDGKRMDIDYKIDILVEDTIIVELKSVERIIPIYEAQLLSYLKISGKQIGLLINFNVEHLRNGIKRMVNG